MLDSKCKPFLLEVNHSPSLSTDSPLDEKVKGNLIRDTISLLGLSKQRKAQYLKHLQALKDLRTKSGKFVRLPLDLKEKLRREFDEVRNEYEIAHLGSFEQIYPTSDTKLALKYLEMLKTAHTLFKVQPNSRK